jgi:hypothetical protein
MNAYCLLVLRTWLLLTVLFLLLRRLLGGHCTKYVHVLSVVLKQAYGIVRDTTW